MRDSAPSAGPDPAAPAALEAWMARHGPELRRHLAGMLGRPGDAEDVLQEVWLAAHRHPPEPMAGGDDGAGVRGWLYRVATNAALDRLATERRRRRALDGRRPDIHGDPAPPPDDGLDGLDEPGRRQVREEVARLPDRQREAVWLRWIEERSYDEIAERMGGSRASARANVYQGLKRLREELSDLWKEVGR